MDQPHEVDLRQVHGESRHNPSTWWWCTQKNYTSMRGKGMRILNESPFRFEDIDLDNQSTPVDCSKLGFNACTCQLQSRPDCGLSEDKPQRGGERLWKKYQGFWKVRQEWPYWAPVLFDMSGDEDGSLALVLNDVKRCKSNRTFCGQSAWHSPCVLVYPSSRLPTKEDPDLFTMQSWQYRLETTTSSCPEKNLESYICPI